MPAGDTGSSGSGLLILVFKSVLILAVFGQRPLPKTWNILTPSITFWSFCVFILVLFTFKLQTSSSKDFMVQLPAWPKSTKTPKTGVALILSNWHRWSKMGWTKFWKMGPTCHLQRLPLKLQKTFPFSCWILLFGRLYILMLVFSSPSLAFCCTCLFLRYFAETIWSERINWTRRAIRTTMVNRSWKSLVVGEEAEKAKDVVVGRERHLHLLAQKNHHHLPRKLKSLHVPAVLSPKNPQEISQEDSFESEAYSFESEAFPKETQEGTKVQTIAVGFLKFCLSFEFEPRLF